MKVSLNAVTPICTLTSPLSNVSVCTRLVAYANNAEVLECGVPAAALYSNTTK